MDRVRAELRNNKKVILVYEAHVLKQKNAPTYLNEVIARQGMHIRDVETELMAARVANQETSSLRAKLDAANKEKIDVRNTYLAASASMTSQRTALEERLAISKRELQASQGAIVELRAMRVRDPRVGEETRDNALRAERALRNHWLQSVNPV